jgi:hypothetical protein
MFGASKSREGAEQAMAQTLFDSLQSDFAHPIGRYPDAPRVEGKLEMRGRRLFASVELRSTHHELKAFGALCAAEVRPPGGMAVRIVAAHLEGPRPGVRSPSEPREESGTTTACSSDSRRSNGGRSRLGPGRRDARSRITSLPSWFGPADRRIDFF